MAQTTRAAKQVPWEIVSTVEDGAEQKGGDREVGEWTFKDGTVRIKSRRKDGKSGEATGFLRFRLDEKADPRRIDCVEGKAADLFDLAAWDKRLADADERMEGIYRINGETLTVCISHKKGDRPKAFESKKGSDHLLVVLKRTPAKDEKKQEQKKDQKKEGGDLPLDRAGIEMRDVDVFLLAEAVKAADFWP